MLFDFLSHVSKFLILYFCISYSYFKIINIKEKSIKLLIPSLLLSISTCILQNYFPSILIFVLHNIIYNFILSKMSNKMYGYSFLILIISICISTIIFSVSSALVSIIWMFISPNNNNLLTILVVDIFEFVFIHLIFKIKRVKNGFPYFNKKSIPDYIDISVTILCISIILIFFITTLYSQGSFKNVYIMLFFSSFLFIPIIKEAFILYHKQKLQLKALKDYEQELSETKQKLETAISEKTNLVRSNHEFYQRQKALNKKLDDLLILQAHSSDVELGEEIGDIISRIDKMNDEYKTKTHTLPNLVKCNIKEIDDMFSYMQYECYKNNIDFILNFNCDIQYIIDNFISQTQLVTLLGDLISNSIIAINHSSNIFRSIMVVFGIKDNSYELCVFDSGIPFEISTLLNLGLKPASTHLDEGGSGSGFITTFETINSCNASFIINEITGTNYTKSLTIRFDGKNDYTIISDRIDKISEMNIDNRNINMNKTLY